MAADAAAGRVFQEYVKEKARLDAGTHWLMDRAESIRQEDRVLREGRQDDQAEAEFTMMQMQRDLERANDSIKRLHEERKTVEQMKALMEETKIERDTMKKEAIKAGTEAELLRRQLKDAAERLAHAERDATGRVPVDDKMAQRLFELEDDLRAAKEAHAEAEVSWERERVVMRQHMDQLKDARETIAGAYDQGRRSGIDEVNIVKNQISAELDDARRAVHALEMELRTASNERMMYKDKADVVPDLEAAVEELKKCLSTERTQNAAETARLKEALVQAQRESDDWRSAFETAEKHKKAAVTQCNDVKAAYTILTQERASLVARLELLSLQGNDTKMRGGADVKSPSRLTQDYTMFRP
eukprot:TRINITY_DN12693_c0_g1_i1.p1 TRINITY_DN12693_c0_g1~~TRINITY_DN12693_c0_g1_i1.p1  ORF type:complete len:382 (+),score=181.82 TRINITY_DN12693_c0_g1_i1:74-1147(+)